MGCVRSWIPVYSWNQYLIRLRHSYPHYQQQQQSQTDQQQQQKTEEQQQHHQQPSSHNANKNRKKKKSKLISKNVNNNRIVYGQSSSSAQLVAQRQLQASTAYDLLLALSINDGGTQKPIESGAAAAELNNHKNQIHPTKEAGDFLAETSATNLASKNGENYLETCV